MRKLLIFACLFSFRVFADPAEINVLVIYTPDAVDAIENDSYYGNNGINSPSDHAQGNIDGMNDILENSGLDDDAVIVNAGVYEMDDFDEDDWGNRDNNDIAEEMNTNPDDHTAGGETIEDIMIETGADIVVIVTHDTNEPGGVAEIPSNTNGDEGNYSMGVEDREIDGDIWSHEMGHLGGLQHAGATGTGVIPGSRGHWNEDSHGEYGTVMTSPSDGIVCSPMEGCDRIPIFSDKDRTGTVEDANGDDRGPPFGDSISDAVDVLEDTLPEMADYAKDRGPAPPEPIITTGFMYCTGPTGTYSITGAISGYTVLNSHYEYKKGSQPWSDIYEGPLTCPTTTSIGSFRVRVTLTTPQGDSEAEQWVTGYPCEPGW